MRRIDADLASFPLTHTWHVNPFALAAVGPSVRIGNSPLATTREGGEMPLRIRNDASLQ